MISKDLLLVFFDENHAVSIGLSPLRLKIIFFTTLLSACTVAALQTVGAILVITMVIPGATAYLLTDRFGVLLIMAVVIGALTSAIGVYLSFYLNGATGGIIVTLQTLFFLFAFYFSPKYGLLAYRYRLHKKNRSSHLQRKS